MEDTSAAAGFKMSALSLHFSEHFNNSLFMQYKKMSSFPYFPFSLLLPCSFSPWVSETLPEAKHWTLICVSRNPLPHRTSWAWENSAASWDDATARGIFQKCGSIWSVTWSFVKDVSLGTRSQLQESWNQFECFMKCRFPTLRVMKILNYWIELQNCNIFKLVSERRYTF